MEVGNTSLIIKILIFIGWWFAASILSVIDFSKRSPTIQVPLPKPIKIILFGWFKAFSYDLFCITMQLGNYVFFAIYVLGDVFGYQYYFEERILFYPLIIAMTGIIIDVLYALIIPIISLIMRLIFFVKGRREDPFYYVNNDKTNKRNNYFKTTKNKKSK